MNSQITTSNDRSRTYWIPSMERYFIDLMLEHMHRGNRSGHSFNKHAWTEMLTTFNAQFGTQYDKDVLKGRYTNLWKQFNDVKNLLSQDGFSWDETREMVVADDSVWNAYIQAHPDARSYRTKPVLNFNDLRVIYEYTTADGRYSRSSHDVDIDDEVLGVNMGDGMVSLAASSSERPRTDWTADMDQYFIELMLDQVGRGNKTDSAFNKQAWTDMLALFNAKFGPQHGKRVLRHRYKKLWKYYLDMTKILNQNGFSWDETQHMIIADDDAWDAYIKGHPYARAYKMKALPNYNDLILVYGNATDNGNLSLHPDKDLEVGVPATKGGEGQGSRTHSGGDRTRTFWTPPMDRFFIDLLLEQVYKGNRIGQTFLAQAWTDIVLSFNEKFQSHHDKDVLKNRYKHLRRQYNDIKNLLENSGFLWDGSREMVVADDYIWDAYVKEHPDSRSYRVKTVPSYDKLCIIFGEESCDGGYNRLAENVDSWHGIPVLMNGEDNSEYFPTSILPFTVDWTEPMDCCFIDLLLKQVTGGNKIDQTFNEQAWAHMVDSFNSKFGVQYNKYILEARYTDLFQKHDDISNILSNSGFSWDEAQQLIIADNNIWEAYIKDNPEAIAYRERNLGDYRDLCKIFGEKGSDERLSGQAIKLGTYHNSLGLEMDGVLGDLQTHTENVASAEQRKRPSVILSDRRRGKVQRTSKDMQRVLEIAGVVKMLVDNRERKDHKAIENAINALQAVPDIEEELLLDGCDLLEDERKAKTFLALDITLRKKWLLRKLRPKDL
ncbi:L10-interacting MYB domain-containing protein [Tripterygium wilfordii]|uniref:L10-interacting MYB domain-containing protein n=1 Tax=Tripterygium wilfordii TaxID=458696 RepID=UPI0018F81833|nr:L10-interacting MYB domain-containing protein [Tripterygium wilfordii]